MNDFQKFIQAARLYVKAAQLFFTTLPLQARILKCNQQLKSPALDPARVRHLEDERFGCQLEVQALKVRIQRLIEEANSSDMRLC